MTIKIKSQNILLSLVVLLFAVSASDARALSCGDVPASVRNTFVSAFHFYKTYINKNANSNDAYRFAVRIAYAHSESTFYPLSANDESYSSEYGVYRLKGLEIAQDLARLDNGRNAKLDQHRASLSSYYETFNRTPYVLKRGGFNTKWGNAALKRQWQAGDVAPRFDVASSTNFGMLQISSDQAWLSGGTYHNILKRMVQLARDPNQVDGVVDWCQSRGFYKDSHGALKREIMNVANTCGASTSPMCFGRWQVLCPMYNALMGSALPEAYFAEGTRKLAQPLCLSSF